MAYREGPFWVRVAVIGAGLFGCTAALYLKRAGHAVTLYEAAPDLMAGATAGTYSRLHRGYHYPRSPETGVESREAEAAFRREYGKAVIDGGRQVYLVPEESTNHVTPGQFEAFLAREGLWNRRFGNTFEVKEPRVDLAGLQSLARQRVWETGVDIKVNTPAPRDIRNQYDKIIVAAYAGINTVMQTLGCPQCRYKFQVVEKPVVVLPKAFRDTSIVVIDGPYGCLDPLDDTMFHVLGHVRETVHAEVTGIRPHVPVHLKGLINQGLIWPDAHSNVAKVVDGLAPYIPQVSEAVHTGSMFTIRAVLADQEKTDCRPTLVEAVDHQVIKVFSGKLGTAVKAAQDVVTLVEKKEAVAA